MIASRKEGACTRRGLAAATAAPWAGIMASAAETQRRTRNCRVAAAEIAAPHEGNLRGLATEIAAPQATDPKVFSIWIHSAAGEI